MSYELHQIATGHCLLRQRRSFENSNWRDGVAVDVITDHTAHRQAVGLLYLFTNMADHANSQASIRSKAGLSRHLQVDRTDLLPDPSQISRWGT